jgi:hypothetical protein
LAIPLVVSACAGNGSGISPTGGRANLVIEQTPNPVQAGSSVTLTQRETAQVGVTAVREVIRFYDASGTLVRTDTYTDEDAWFSCGNPERSVRSLAAGESCSSTYTAASMFPQYEYDLYVRDDNGNDLVFHTSRFITVQ